MKRLVNLISGLLQSTPRGPRLPEFYDLELERRVREQLKIVTHELNAAIAAARQNRTIVAAPDLSGQIGFAGLQFSLVDKVIDGIVEVTYTGPQANAYHDILTKKANVDSRIMGVEDLCTVHEPTFQRAATKDDEPTVTAQLRLPVEAVFSN